MARFPGCLNRNPVEDLLIDAMKDFSLEEVMQIRDLGLIDVFAGSSGGSLWTAALLRNRPDVARALWADRDEYGAGVEFLNEPLLDAIVCGDAPVIRWLVAQGARLRDPVYCGQALRSMQLESPLHFALKVGASRSTIELLLSLGADPTKDRGAPVGLMETAVEAGVEWLEILERLGCRFDRVDVLIYALGHADEATMRWLLERIEHPQDYVAILRQEFSRCDETALLLLLEKAKRCGWNPADVRRQGLGLLSWAIYNKCPLIFRFLLDSGRDPNTPDPGCASPLHVVSTYGDAQSLAMLLRAPGLYLPPEGEDPEFWDGFADAPKANEEMVRRASRARGLSERIGQAMRVADEGGAPSQEDAGSIL